MSTIITKITIGEKIINQRQIILKTVSTLPLHCTRTIQTYKYPAMLPGITYKLCKGRVCVKVNYKSNNVSAKMITP